MLLAEMTFQQFLQNPTGPYSSFFGKRENIKTDLETRFGKLLGSAKNKAFDCKLYKEKNNYYFHIKVPSEQFSSIIYDVVIELVPKSTAVLTEGTLLNYHLMFFSNSPSFVYTYAYISKKDKLLIPFLEGKLNEAALTKAPSVKNPIEIYGFEKSIYFALLYIKYKNFHVKTALPPIDKEKPFSHSMITSNCKDSDTIMKEYNIEKQKEKLKKQQEKKTAQQQANKLAASQRRQAAAQKKTTSQNASGTTKKGNFVLAQRNPVTEEDVSNKTNKPPSKRANVVIKPKKKV